MRKCPNCGEYNGDTRTTCFSCSSHIGSSIPNIKKVCPRCHAIYGPSARECDDCHCDLAVYSGSAVGAASRESSASGALIAVSVLVPLLGFILGVVYIARGEDHIGKSCIIAGVVSFVVCVFLLMLV